MVNEKVLAISTDHACRLVSVSCVIIFSIIIDDGDRLRRMMGNHHSLIGDNLAVITVEKNYVERISSELI